MPDPDDFTTESSPRKLISIVIPVFNEEKNVGHAYEAVCDVFDTSLPDFDFEIVFTDNHSTEATKLEIEKIAIKDSRVLVASFTRNFGFNRSLITAIRRYRCGSHQFLDLASPS